MLGIMASMYQKDFYALVILSSGMCKAGILGARFAVCSRSVFGRLVMLGITAGMDQKEGYVVPCRKLRKIRSCSSSRSSSFLSLCRGGSHGLTDHGNSPVAGQGR